MWNGTAKMHRVTHVTSFGFHVLCEDWLGSLLWTVCELVAACYKKEKKEVIGNKEL